MHTFGVIAIFTPILKEILHIVFGVTVPALICPCVVAVRYGSNKLTNSAFFPEVCEFVRDTCDEDEHQGYRDRYLESFLPGSGPLRNLMLTIDQTPDQLFGHRPNCSAGMDGAM